MKRKSFQILSEKNRLVRRTQTKRSDTERIGCSEEVSDTVIEAI